MARSDHAAELALEEVGRHRELIPTNTTALLRVMELSLDEAQYRMAGDTAASWSDTWKAFARAMQASSALFLVASATEGEIEFRLDDEVRHRAATGPLDEADVLVWTDALYLSMICREKQRIRTLTAMDLQPLRRDHHDEYVFSWARCLQTYWRRGDGLIDQLLEAMRGTEPAGLRHRTEAMALKLDFPVLQLFYHLTQRDEDAFNDALAKALELHREYWTEVNPRDPRGFIALGPLAVACLARGAGLWIEVESHYLPEILLTADRVGELTL